MFTLMTCLIIVKTYIKSYSPKPGNITLIWKRDYRHDPKILWNNNELKTLKISISLSQIESSLQFWVDQKYERKWEVENAIS